MKIQKYLHGYEILIKFKSTDEHFKITADFEFGVNFPAVGDFKTKEDKDALIEGIEMAYKLYKKEIKFEPFELQWEDDHEERK